MNRPKLTAKHPRPAAPARPPVRPGAHAQRNSARPATATVAAAAPAVAPAAPVASPPSRTADAKPVARTTARPGARPKPKPSYAKDAGTRSPRPPSAGARADIPRSGNAEGRRPSERSGTPRAQAGASVTQAPRRNARPDTDTGAQARLPRRAPAQTHARPAKSDEGAAAPRPRAAAPSRVREDDEAGSMRLSKRMSELGLCSRREADNWIEQGLVRVDGVIVDTLGSKVRLDQKIEILPAARAEQAKLATILIHKPVGYVSGQPEDDYLPAAALITAATQWEGDASGRRFQPLILRALAPAGRLDIDSTGLLVMTQDGRIAKQLIGEHSEVDKEYLVRVRYQGRDTDSAAHFPAEKLALLRHGLTLDDVALRPAQVDWQNGEQLRFVLREGRKRQIRRMCELVGLEVVGLKRIRIGKIMLGALPPGQWRFLQPGEGF